MYLKKFAEILIDTFHNIWIGIFTGGFVSITLGKTGKIGIIITLWGSVMLLVSSCLKTLINLLNK